MSPENQTLREALKEYYQLNPHTYQVETMDDHSKRNFTAHDIAHVVFGCDTSIRGENKLGAWCLFGTNLGYWGYSFGFQRAPEARKAFYKTVFSLGLINSATIYLKSLPTQFQVWKRTRKMKKKWPFYEYHEYLDKTLFQIRQEFLISTL